MSMTSPTPSHQPASASTSQGGAAVTQTFVQKMVADTIQKLNLPETGPALAYRKPYPSYHDDEQFPHGYSHPTFKAFDGTGNPIEHLAYFIANCGDRKGSLLLRQFVKSLPGAAFVWYTKLPPKNSIPDWPAMETAFLNRFFTTKRAVSITELTQTKQRPNESAADFLTRWITLSVHCSQHLERKRSKYVWQTTISTWHYPYMESLPGSSFRWSGVGEDSPLPRST